MPQPQSVVVVTLSAQGCYLRPNQEGEASKPRGGRQRGYTDEGAKLLGSGVTWASIFPRLGDHTGPCCAYGVQM